jgi:hypothetical protein
MRLKTLIAAGVQTACYIGMCLFIPAHSRQYYIKGDSSINTALQDVINGVAHLLYPEFMFLQEHYRDSAVLCETKHETAEEGLERSITQRWHGTDPPALAGSMD